MQKTQILCLGVKLLVMHHSSQCLSIVGTVPICTFASRSHLLHGHGQPWPAMAGHGLPWPAIAGHGWPWQAIAGHGWPWPAIAGHGRPWSAMAGHSWAHGAIMAGHDWTWLAMASLRKLWQAMKSHIKTNDTRAWTPNNVSMQSLLCHRSCGSHGRGHHGHAVLCLD